MLITGISTVFATAAQADSVIPPQRYQGFMDTDYYGSDLQALFDTDLASCQAACSAQDSCAGFSYNSRSNACFPKQNMQS
ncbi:PAN/Apple domain-containing protein, partial [Pseudophaeobacter sp.]